MPNTIFLASDPRHGTRSGYTAHRRRQETPCEPCAEANRRRNREQRERDAAKKFNPHQAYTCEEVEFLAGTDHPERIAVRLGYAEFDYLRTVLKRWRRRDLVELLEKTT